VAVTESFRLPADVRPRRYQIELHPDLARQRFEGTVVVTLDVLEPTNRLVLNAAELDLSEARVETPDGDSWPGEVSLNEAEQQASVTLVQVMPARAGYALHLRFAGALNDQLQGFYRSTYRDDEGVDRVIATTQFEPTDARRAFPCWDEPAFKATFAVSLIVDDGVEAISNGPVTSTEELGGGLRRVTFEETMIMSTYLVAFVVGPFELTPARQVDATPLRIAAVPGRLPLTHFALDAAEHALRFLARYFEIPYPGRKMDHVAIPDFASGAMENLGCITYRENALLADTAAASQVELQRVATVIAHETAHMWFGDLVTMMWWDGVWLKEAFATFMELTTTEDLNPDWQVWTAFGAGKSAALATDGLRATRPVVYKVGRPEEAEAMFDVLTYQKGGAVLRMLEQYLGPETFRKGISQYLNTHAYANTETRDLWAALQAASGEPVATIMDSWISQGGFPIVSVETGPEPSSVVLGQSRFLYDGSASDQRWSVPINVRVRVDGEVQRHRVLLDEGTAELTVDGPVDWVVVNDGAWGFYRVRYSQEMWGRLRRAGVQTVMDPLERVSLVSDTWAAVVAGMADLSEWVPVVEALGEEHDGDVWGALNGVFTFLALSAHQGDVEPLREFVRRTARPAWAHLGWAPSAGESSRTATARARVLEGLALIGSDPETGDEAVQRFRSFVAAGDDLAPDLVSCAARATVAREGAGGWQTVLEQYKRASSPQDRMRYLFALTESPDPATLRRTLDLALTDDVRTQDSPFLIPAVMRNRTGAAVAWEWLEQHWAELNSRFPDSQLARAFEGIPSVVEPGLAAAIRRFCSTHDVPQAGPRLDQLLERMDINVGLAGRLQGSLAGVLSS
jgi:puromycin-sensitive aminopeptidase